MAPPADLDQGDALPRQARLGEDRPTICTIGHATRPIDELVAMLHEADVGHLVDVRRFPSSKHNPQFNQGTLSQALTDVDIAYTHEPRMGGYRDELEEGSPNVGWEATGFKAYADHMATGTFQDALATLLDRAGELDPDGSRVAIMCAEKAPERCHRRLVSDQLTALGYPVVHLIEPGDKREHEMTSFARVRDQRVIYPG